MNTIFITFQADKKIKMEKSNIIKYLGKSVKRNPWIVTVEKNSADLEQMYDSYLLLANRRQPSPYKSND